MMWVRALLIEIGPILLFAVTDYFYSFTTATAVMIASTFLGVIYTILKGDRLPRFAILSTTTFSIFGLATIIFNDPTYLILSDTILDGLFAILLLGSLLLRKTLLQILFENIFAITDRGWRILSLRWGLLFLFLATVNEIIRLNFSEQVWVYYKLSTIVIILGFGLYQFTLSRKERLPESSNTWGMRVG